MLILSRQPGERIVIGDQIRIQILRVRKGDHVVLGVEAPIDVPVDREEVRQAKMESDNETQRQS